MRAVRLEVKGGGRAAEGDRWDREGGRGPMVPRLTGWAAPFVRVNTHRVAQRTHTSVVGDMGCTEQASPSWHVVAAAAVPKSKNGGHHHEPRTSQSPAVVALLLAVRLCMSDPFSATTA